MLATAIYVTGNSRLEPGRRYAIALDKPRLKFLSTDSPGQSEVALDAPLTGVDVASVEGRLVITWPDSKSGVILAFMSLSGLRADLLGGAIVAASRGDVS